MSELRIVCVCCQDTEVDFFSLCCTPCKQQLSDLGVLEKATVPTSDADVIQIGPLDI